MAWWSRGETPRTHELWQNGELSNPARVEELQQYRRQAGLAWSRVEIK